MAKVVKEYDFSSRPSGRQKYPWDNWMNGQIWALKHGTKDDVKAGRADFDVKPASFANNAASYGSRHEDKGIKTVNVSIEGDTIYVQAVLMPDVGDEPDEE
jgi:hypothetical protein